MDQLKQSCENLVRELRHKICVEQKIKKSEMKSLKVDLKFKIKMLPSWIEEDSESYFLVAVDERSGSFIHLAEFFEGTFGWYTENGSQNDTFNDFVDACVKKFKSKREYCEEDFQQFAQVCAKQFDKFMSL